ncbi:dual-specificity tyrosine-(Y)-phosphorylation regulated kinase [Rhizoctonia solani AG-1 IB]|uniref:Dual-specificity tyrosine-(Y)-phosphorylation regulated kinase n=1 Tax=Thanatephorus cucumeris (strain AG1-IB / isolate 7/3/14) TaxID=1108050 RepID=M5BK45_THACB|nr:dual-specificity tyrosine-(Y)-phosphorylation regulated kinase [Rhizoctonia solani AG-1 IB]
MKTTIISSTSTIGSGPTMAANVLGQGTFGQVVKCQNIKTHEIVAVKVVKNKPAYFNQSMMEVTILELLNTTWDPNDEHHILRMRDQFIHKNHLCLVFELLSSNLYELIKQNQFGGLSTQLVKVFTAQLLDALTVLNEARLIHCDLKPENILLMSYVPLSATQSTLTRSQVTIASNQSHRLWFRVS